MKRTAKGEEKRRAQEVDELRREKAILHFKGKFSKFQRRKGEKGRRT